MGHYQTEMTAAHARTLLHAVGEALLLADGAGRVLLANPAAERLLGHPPGSLTGRALSDVMPALPGVMDLPERPLEATAVDLGGNTRAVQLTPTRTTEDGQARLVLHLRAARGTPSLDVTAAERRLQLQLGVTRVLAEEASREGTARTVLDGLRRTLGWDVAALWTMGEDGKLHLADGAATEGEPPRRFLDATRDVVLSVGEGVVGGVWASRQQRWLLDAPGEMSPERRAAARQAQLRSGVAFPVVMGASAIAVVELYALSERTRDDDLLEVLSGIGWQVGQVLERQRVEGALRRSEQQLRLISDALPAGVALLDRQLHFWFANRACAEALGMSQEAVLARGLEEVVGAASVASMRAHLEAALAGQGATLDRVESATDGRVRDVRITFTPHRRTDGAVDGVVMLTVDTTDVRRTEDQLRRTEEQLRQSLKMQALGRLTGGVAHDFNNLLTAIIGHTELLLEAAGGPEDPVRPGLEEIKTAGERAAALTRQLLAYSRKQRPAPRLVDLNDVVSDLDRLLRRLIGDEVEVRTFLQPALRAVRADPNQLEQVVLNLAINARDAMPEGGKLTLETRNFTLEEEYAEARFSLSPGDYVMLAISDSGQGMDEATRNSLFDHLFTGGEEGQVTGLGLSVVQSIVKSAGGQILVYSEKGLGTAFKVYLPAAVADARAPLRRPAPPRPVTVRDGSETILLVEDEPSVRSLMRKALMAHGYVVLEATRGEAALKVAGEFQGPIHLLVTDVVLGGLSGRQVAERLCPTRKELKVLYISGYTDEAIVRHGVLETGSAFLNKPFAPSSLAVRVREILDAAPAA